MISLTERAGFALNESLSEEDRVTGKIFKVRLLDDRTVELQKEVPIETDETLEHNGYPVLAIPSEIVSVFDNLSVDVAPAPDGQSMALVIKSGNEI